MHDCRVCLYMQLFLSIFADITISTNVSLKNPGSPNVSISFQANCSMNYSILIANGNSTVCDHTAMPDENGTVMFNIDDGLKTNEEYNFTVAENSTESVEDMMDDPSGSFSKWNLVLRPMLI